MNIKDRAKTLGREVYQLYVGGLITAVSVLLKEGVVRAVLTWVQVFTGVLLAGQSGIAPQVLGDFGWETAVAVANVSAIVALITSLRFLASDGLKTLPEQKNDYTALHEEYRDAITANTLIVEDSLGYPHLVEEQPEDRLPITDHEDERVSNYTQEEALEAYGRNSPAAKEEG